MAFLPMDAKEMRDRGWNEVESDLAGAPVYFDTAFSYGPVTPLPDAPRAPYISYNLHPKDFVRLVRKHGTDKILFGTDSPWENQQGFCSCKLHLNRFLRYIGKKRA